MCDNAQPRVCVCGEKYEMNDAECILKRKLLLLLLSMLFKFNYKLMVVNVSTVISELMCTCMNYFIFRTRSSISQQSWHFCCSVYRTWRTLCDFPMWLQYRSWLLLPDTMVCRHSYIRCIFISCTLRVSLKNINVW